MLLGVTEAMCTPTPADQVRTGNLLPLIAEGEEEVNAVAKIGSVDGVGILNPGTLCDEIVVYGVVYLMYSRHFRMVAAVLHISLYAFSSS